MKGLSIRTLTTRAAPRDRLKWTPKTGPVRKREFWVRTGRRVTRHWPWGGEGCLGSDIAKIADGALTKLDIDVLGLDIIDKKILNTIVTKFDGGPVGVGTIAVSIGEEVDTVEDVYEPYLIQLGFIKRTSKGRMATDLAFKHLGIENKQKKTMKTTKKGFSDRNIEKMKLENFYYELPS